MNLDANPSTIPYLGELYRQEAKAQQLQKNAVQMMRFQQRTNELTADLRENRILKYTLW